MLRRYYDKRGVHQAYSAFKSKGYSEEWTINGAEKQFVAMETLPPFLRTLLVTDGTVTKSLEAFYWEPIEIETKFQEVITAEADIDWLGICSGDEVLTRSVCLRGARSNRIYARALSLIRFALIPEELRNLLFSGKLGIGELIRDCGLETYRELLEINTEGEAVNACFNRVSESDFNSGYVYRTYRIILNHTPAILVTECFPIELFVENGKSAAEQRAS